MQNVVVSKRAKKYAPRKVANAFENMFRNVSEEYIQGQLPPPPVPKITPRRVFLGQCEGY